MKLLIKTALQQIDLLIMILLFLSGTVQIDIFHVGILIIFAFYIVFPETVRQNFIYVFLFYMTIMIFKYVQSLFDVEFDKAFAANP
jgi:hypothetical protein